MVDNENEKSFLDSNTILAIVLSFAVFIVWQMYMGKNYPSKEAQENAVAEQSAEQTKDTINQPTAQDMPSASQGSHDQVPVRQEIQAPEMLERFEGQNLSLEISNRGMGLKNIVLKSVTDRAGNPIHFSWTEDGINREFLSENLPEKLTNQTIISLLKEGNYSTTYDGRPVYFILKKETENTFVGRANVAGGELTKTIVFDDETYSARVETFMKWNGENRGTLQTMLFDRIKTKPSSWFAPSYEGTDVINISEGSEKRQRLELDENFGESYQHVTLSAIGSQYFALILRDQSDIVPVAKSESYLNGSVGFAKTTLGYLPSANPSLQNKHIIYMGPKDYDILASIDPEMASVINFGFFGFIAKPILQLLKFLHGLLGNWGIAIIILTLIVRLILFPVAMSSMRSMKKMQKLQPKLKVIKEKFKDDPQKMNLETMALMKQEGANPLGGCLPMFAQIPVFFALYSVLGVSVELYKAPFVFWIKDLSNPDPLFVLPVLVSLLFFLQMKLSPSTMDPQQQKVMMIMPLVFGLLMFSLPAGLLVYFITNTVFGIGQQFFINREKATS